MRQGAFRATLLKFRLKPLLLLLVIRSINGTAMTKINCRLALANGQLIRKERALAQYRMSTPFFNLKAIALMSLAMCTIVLAVFLSLPTGSQFMGLYELACIFIVFPLVVAIGGGSQISGALGQAVQFRGRYILPCICTALSFCWCFHYVGALATCYRCSSTPGWLCLICIYYSAVMGIS